MFAFEPFRGKLKCPGEKHRKGKPDGKEQQQDVEQPKATLTDKELREEQTLYIEHGKPLVFGKDQSKGIRLRGTDLEVVEFGDGVGPEECLVWDEDRRNPALAFLLAQLGGPEFPTPIGVFRAVDSPAYDAEVVAQIDHAIETKGQGKLEDLIYSGDIWEVGEDGAVLSR